MATQTVKLPDINEVSRQAVPLKEIKVERDEKQVPHSYQTSELAVTSGVKLEETSLDLNDKTGKTLKTIHFPKVRFEESTGPEDTPDERFARMVAFFQTAFPPVKGADGTLQRANNPLDIIASHVSYSLDLTMRNGIRSKEAALLEGPDKAMLKQAEKLAQFKGISIEAALAKVKAAWE